MNRTNDTDSQTASPTPCGEGVWTLSFPLRFLGLRLGRRVTLLRISGDRLVIHSTGPFGPDTVQAIRALGKPVVLLEATTMHDTFSRRGRAAFPEAEYYVPENFPPKAGGTGSRSVRDLDEATDGEVRTIRLEGIRYFTEYACFHPASRTLILCDLLFNLDDARGYTRWAMKFLMGVKQWPAVDRPVRMAVKNKGAFEASLRQVLEWDFDRIVVAHGSIIETEGETRFIEAVQRAGFLPSP